MYFSERNDQIEICNDLLDFLIEMRKRERHTLGSVKKELKAPISNEEELTSILLPKSLPVAAGMLVAFIFALLLFCFGLKALSKL